MDMLLTFTRQLGFFLKILNVPWWVSNHHSLYLLILHVLGIMLWSYQHDQKWNNEKAKYKQKMATRREDTFNVNNKNATLHGVHNKGSFTQQQSLKNILECTPGTNNLYRLGAWSKRQILPLVMFKCHFRCLEGPSSKWMILTIFGYGVMSSLAAQRFFGWRSTRMRPSVLSNCVAFVRLGSGE